MRLDLHEIPVLLLQLESFVGLPFFDDLGFIASTDGPFLKTDTRPPEASNSLFVRKTSYRGARLIPGIKAPECQRYHVSSVCDGARDDGIQTFIVSHHFLYVSYHSWRVLDITVAMAYAMLSAYGKANRGMSAAAAMLRGFQSVKPLLPVERKHLVLLVVCRLACSATLGAYSYQQNPENKYLLLHSEPAWKALEMIWAYDDNQRTHTRSAFNRLLDQACLYTATKSKSVDCSDLVCSDPMVEDLLASVRMRSTFEKSPPSPKKRRLSTQGLPIITFVTGNIKKLIEVRQILGISTESQDSSLPFDMDHHKVDLPELQGDPVDIAKQKCMLASAKVGGACITEDTSLCFNALYGLPGPYIKWFLDKCGHEGLNKMLDGYEDRTGYAQTIVCFCAGPGKSVAVFDGRTNGKIVRPRGPANFGWDPIFEPSDNNSGKTYAEMSSEEKNAISHRSRALVQLREYLQANAATLRDEIN